MRLETDQTTTTTQYTVNVTAIVGAIVGAIVLLCIVAVLMRFAPCVTGELVTRTVTAADGRTFTATLPAPVCPEAGQTYIRAAGLVAVVMLAVLLAIAATGRIIVGVMLADAEGDRAVGQTALAIGQTPPRMTASDPLAIAERIAALERTLADTRRLDRADQPLTAPPVTVNGRRNGHADTADADTLSL